MEMQCLSLLPNTVLSTSSTDQEQRSSRENLMSLRLAVSLELTRVSRGTGDKEKQCLWAEWALFTSPLSLLWVGNRPIAVFPAHFRHLHFSLCTLPVPCQNMTVLLKTFSSVDTHISNELSPLSSHSLMPGQPLAQSARVTRGYATKQCPCLDFSASLELVFLPTTNKEKPLVWVFLYLADFFYYLESVFPDLLWEVGASLARQPVRQRSIDPKGTSCGWVGEKLSWEHSQQDPPPARNTKQVQNSFTKVSPQERTCSHLIVLLIHASHTIWRNLIVLTLTFSNLKNKAPN